MTAKSTTPVQEAPPPRDPRVALEWLLHAARHSGRRQTGRNPRIVIEWLINAAGEPPSITRADPPALLRSLLDDEADLPQPRGVKPR